MKTLRIGFLLQDTLCPQWQLDIIQRVHQSAGLEVALFAFNGERKTASQQNPELRSTAISRILKPLRLVHSLLNPRAFGIASLYHRFDLKRNKPLSKLWDTAAVQDYPEVQKLTLQPIRKGFTHRFHEEDIHALKAANLDVLIRFGFSIIRGKIHTTAKFGVWSFHHGDNRFYRGGPPGIWELIKGKRDISVTLQQLNDVLDCGSTIGRYTHRADLYSVLKNKHRIYSSCGDLLLQKLEQTQAYGFDSITSTWTFQEAIPDTDILTSPNNRACWPLLKNLAKHYIQERWPRNKKIQWFLAIKPYDNALNRFAKTSLLMPPLDRFYADPFIVEHGEQEFIFFEELIYSHINAHISVGELSAGKLINIRPIIIEDFHLSYPCIFQDQGQWYLIPESRQNRDVRLYRCVKFPYEWELESTLINDIELLDVTVHQREDGYYLFANEYHPGRKTSNECLVVYFAERLQGPWQPHPLNPLATNISNSRPAGKLFQHNNSLILPTQNCARRYGHAINFNEIQISKTHFSMKKISQLTPDWQRNNLGTHTWNSSSRHIVTDGHRYIDR